MNDIISINIFSKSKMSKKTKGDYAHLQTRSYLIESGQITDVKEIILEQRNLSLYSKNQILLALLLSIDRRSNIVRYKSIQRLNDANMISMEDGLDYNQQMCWYGNVSIAMISPDQKLELIADVCRGLMNLTQLNILHLNVSLQNIVKMRSSSPSNSQVLAKNTFRLAGFDNAFCVSASSTYPRYRNFLRGSELQTIKQQLCNNLQQILLEQLKLRLQGGYTFLLQKLQQYPFIAQILKTLNSQQDLKSMANQIKSQLINNIELIHSTQLAKLIKSLFPEDDFEQIQKIRQVIRLCAIGYQQKKSLKDLMNLLESNNIAKRCSLPMFYSQLVYANNSKQLQKAINLCISQNQLIKSISDKQYSQFWKDVLTTKHGAELNQYFQQFNQQNNHARWYSLELQTKSQQKIQQTIGKFIKQFKILQEARLSGVSNNQLLYFNQIHIQIPDFQIIIKAQKCDPSNAQKYEEKSSLISSNIHYLQLNNKFTSIIASNRAENYFAFKLLLSKYVSTIHSPYLSIPEKLCLDQNTNMIKIYYKRQANEFQQLYSDQPGIQSVWNKGFANVIKFLKDIAKGILDLQNNGLFHPEINMQNILSLRTNENQRKYKLTQLQKCYFLSFKYMLNEEQEILLNINKNVLYHLFNSQPNRQLPLDNLIEFKQQLEDKLQEQYEKLQKDNFIYSKDLIETNRTTILFQNFRQFYNKMHSKQLGQIFTKLYKQYKKRYGRNQYYPDPSRDQICFVPYYWIQKFDKANRIVLQYLNTQMKNRITVQSFFLQFNELFPTCEVTYHQDEMTLYYYKEKEEKHFLCNKCIQESKELNVQFYCIDHHKPIRYLSSNPNNIIYFGKSYYCQQCCEALPSQTEVKLIDSTNLDQCRYICMDPGCNEYLISERNRRKNHDNHVTITLDQFNKFFEQANAENSNETIKYCSNKGNALISQFQKITTNYMQKTTSLFKQITTFKVQGSSQCQRLNEILRPTSPDVKMYKKCKVGNSTQTDFWRVLKVMHCIYNKSTQKQFQMISIERFVQYCNFRFQELASQANSRIQIILSQLYQKFQNDIFSPDIHNNIRRFTEQKYGGVINNERTNQNKPCQFTQIPPKCDQVVKQLKIQRDQLYLQNYFQLRNIQRIQFHKYCQQRCQLYKKWTVLIEKQNQNFTLIDKKQAKHNKSRDKRRSFIDEYQLLQTELINSINQQKKTIDKLRTSKQNEDSQKLNLQAFSRKRQMLQYQKNSLETIIKDLQKIKKSKDFLKSNQNLQQKNDNFQKIKEQRNQIIKLLNQNSEIITAQLRAFNLQFMHNPRSFDENEISKIGNFINLQIFQLNQQPNSMFTSKLLQNILKKCDKLKKIKIKGGYIELLSCLEKLIHIKNDQDFTFYTNNENVINQKNQIQQLHKSLKMAKFEFPCVNIRLRKNIDKDEKDKFIDILQKILYLKLEIYGPLKTNGYTIQILNKVIEKNIKVISLLLRKFKKNGYRNILTEISKRGQIQKLYLINCVDYNEQFLMHCKDHLQTIVMRGSLSIEVPNQFMKNLLFCQNLRQIRFNKIAFNTDNLKLNALQRLKSLMFQYCPQIPDKFVLSINKKALKLIERIMFIECAQITDACIEVLTKMPQLKYLNLSTKKILIENLLNLQTTKLQILNFRRGRDINDQLLKRFGQKWPRLIGLAIPQFSSVSANMIKQNFKHLKNLIIFKNQFSKEQQYKFMQRKINVQEYN